MARAIPPRLKVKQTLKRLCYEYNGFEGLNYDNIAETSILGLDVPSDDIYKLMLLAVCDEYWYAEIGFDIDEIFIERFQDTWYRYSSTYHTVIANYLENDVFNRSRTITSNEKNTGGTAKVKSGDDTVTNTAGSRSTKTGTETQTRQAGQNTTSATKDYQVQTQDSEQQINNNSEDVMDYDTTVVNKQNVENKTEYNSKDNYTQDLARDRTITEDYKDFTVEKLREMLGSVDIINEFVHCFDRLFMQILLR